MRETEYRAWDKKNKKMIYGIQNHFDCDSCFNEHYSGGEIQENYGCQHFGDFLNNDRFEVMQLITPKSDHIPQIYENDILEWTIYPEDENPLRIRDTAMIGELTGVPSVKKRQGTILSLLSRQIKVIGNFNENPKLLEVKNVRSK